MVEGFKERDMDRIASHLHKDYRSITYPRSLGEGEETKEEWLKKTAEVVGLWTHLEASPANLLFSFNFDHLIRSPQPTLHSVIETPGTVVVHVRI